MKKLFNEDLIKILLSILLFVISLFIPNELIKNILIILSYIIVSYELYIEAFENIKEKEFFDENVLMIIATLGAFFIGSTEEAVMVILLFQIGEYLSDLAVDKSKESITKLMDLRVEKVNLVIEGTIKEVKVEKIKLNDIFIVKPGEKIPLDGTVIEGESYLDTSSLTGESVPRKVSINDNVLSGCINKDSVIRVKATSTFKTSTSQKIIELIENSNDEKSQTETFIRKFSKIYTPIVVLCAILLTVIPTIIYGNLNEWLYRSLVFLVTSCPCALVISVPLGYFCGIGASSKQGILIKGSQELDKLTNIDYLVLDKTGTITEGVFEVTKIKTDMDEEKFINIIASAEENSIHPIANAIKNKNKEKVKEVKEYKEISGKGISCKIGKDEILVGNNKLLDENNIEYDKSNDIGTIIYLSVNNKCRGYLVISDKIKETSKNLKDLYKVINKEIIILSGDNHKIVEDVAKKVGVKNFTGDLLPIDKVEKVKECKEKGKVMFVGDGINDAPVIKISDIGVSMGALGSDAAIEASDIVLMRDDLTKIKSAILIARNTKKKVKQSIFLALLVKFIVLILGVFGISTIWMAVFADVGVTLLAVLNVLRIFIKKSY